VARVKAGLGPHHDVGPPGYGGLIVAARSSTDSPQPKR
jgi:hypothetical protein